MTDEPELSPSLERVMATYARMVRHLSRRRGLADSEVEEVLQDVRIRLWRALPDARMKRVTTSYVYRTAMSAVCDHVRRRRNSKTESLDDLAPADSGRLAAPTRADDALERSELARRVDLALSQLSDNRRPVLRMYLAGYAQAEIQEVFGWTEARTRNLLYRGLSDLRLALGRLGVGSEIAG